MVQLIGKKAMNLVVSHNHEVVKAVRDENDEVYRRAKANLAQARSSSHWEKIHGPDHLTKVTKSEGDVDGFTNLEAPNPMAIEFGHAPSGVFGPGGSLGHLETKAPHGLYIITRAARLGGINFVPATGRGGG